MASNASGSTKIKRVPPYPFAISLKPAAGVATGEVKGMVLKVTPMGFLADIVSSTIQTGEKFEAIFTMPLQEKEIKEPVVILKIYSRATGTQGKDAPSEAPAAAAPAASPAPATPDGSRLIEAHFHNLSPAAKALITSFMRAIRQ